MQNGRLRRDRDIIKVAKRLAVLSALTIVLSSASFAPRALGGDTDTPADIEMEGLDPNLVTAVWSASLDFAEDVTQRINISEEGFGGEKAIDDLITLMQVTLGFTSEVLGVIHDNETVTETGTETETETESETETNLTRNETGFIPNERIEEAFEYLRFLQSDNPCEAAINKMDTSGTRDY